MAASASDAFVKAQMASLSSDDPRYIQSASDLSRMLKHKIGCEHLINDPEMIRLMYALKVANVNGKRLRNFEQLDSWRTNKNVLPPAAARLSTWS